MTSGLAPLRVGLVLALAGCVPPEKGLGETGDAEHIGRGSAVTVAPPEPPELPERDSGDTGEFEEHGAWVDLDIRGNIVCAVANTGALTCWDDLPDRDYREISFAGDFTAVAVGNFYACAMNAGGQLSCATSYDELDDYGQFDPPGGVFGALDADIWQACGIHPDLSIECWGWEWENQAEKTTGAFLDVEVGMYMSCGVTTDGVVRCWGDFPGLDDTWVPTDRTYVQVAVGPTHACALDTWGVPFCWGGRNLEVLAVPEGQRFRQLAAAADLTCGVGFEGEIHCWIADVATPDSDDVLQHIPEGANWRVVKGFSRLACALDMAGGLTCWGSRTNSIWGGDAPKYPDP